MISGVMFQGNLVSHTRDAIGTALKPVAPINGLIFFVANRLYTFTAMMPPAIDIANATNPPITIRIVCGFKNAFAVMVAPTAKPRKIVAAFMIVSEAAEYNRPVRLPNSLTRLPKSNIPTKGTDDGTNNETTVPRAIGKSIFTVWISLMGLLDG